MFGIAFRTIPFVALAASLAAAQIAVVLPDSIAAAGAQITWVKKLPFYCEGPAWEPSTGAVYFSQLNGGGGPIWKVRPGVDTAGAVFVSAGSTNGMAFDKQGRLVACQNGRLARYKSDGTLDSVLTPTTAGITIGQANDLTIGSNGGIYFTDLGTRVYFLTPGRQLKVVRNSSGVLADITYIMNANGIEWLEEENAVYLNMTGTVNRIARFSIQAGTDSLLNPTLFEASPGPDGGTIDSHGNRFVADNVNGEVRVFNARGDSIGHILLRLATGSYDAGSGIRSNVSNCVFGGADLRTLYITGDGGLYSIPLKIAGRATGATTAIRRFPGLSITKTHPEKSFGLDALGRNFWSPNYRLFPAAKAAKRVPVSTP